MLIYLYPNHVNILMTLRDLINLPVVCRDPPLSTWGWPDYVLYIKIPQEIESGTLRAYESLRYEP